jgi:arylsulfatase A
MNRLNILTNNTVALIILACLFFSPSTVRGDESTPKKNPNILFVLFDDMGYGQPTCYRNQSKLKTPNFDRLAGEGMRFTDAHTASSVCTPTRYGVLTGRYPSRIGQYGVLTTYSSPIIASNRLTVASLLKQQGYETACIGKWHLGMEWEKSGKGDGDIPINARIKTSPNVTGFDYFYGYTHARNIGTIIEQDRVVENVPEVDNQPRMIAKAVQWIGQRKNDKPFFLYFPMCPPHTPVIPSSEFAGKSGAIDEVKHDSKYGDWVYQGDHMLGQLLEALERNGLASNTIVIATADNGAAGREYAPLRGAKTSIYEGGHRVPFVVRWPGKVSAGTVCEDTICLNDLMATCAEIGGAKIPDTAGEDSASILPDLLGRAEKPVHEAIIHQDYSGGLAIRQGPWKLIFGRGGRDELYNLKTDLGERTNVADANPEIVSNLTRLMEKYIDAGRSTPGLAQKNDAVIDLGKKKSPVKKKGQKTKGEALVE